MGDGTGLATNRPRKAWTNSKAFRRLQRELRGGNFHWDPRFYRPAEIYCETLDRGSKDFWVGPTSKPLKIVRMDSLLGQQELRDYIILGEKPTFPYYLIAMRRPRSCFLVDFLNLVPAGSRSWTSFFEDSSPSASISYWALDLTSNTITEVPSPGYSSNALRLSDYTLSAAFTAWDLDHDKLAQVLVWNFVDEQLLGLVSRSSGVDSIVWQQLEFRYGTQRIVVSNEHACERYHPRALGVCFAGLVGTQEGGHVRLVFSTKVVLYEPFGGPGQNGTFWVTAPETSDGESTSPRVTTINLDHIAAAHLATVLKSYADVPPEFAYPHSAFVAAQRPIRFKPGERMRFDRRCMVGFGAIEASSKMYHLFIMSLDTVTRTHRILIAKAFSSSVEFGWDNMVTMRAGELFQKALARVVRVRSVNHDCRFDCESVEGLRGLEAYGRKAVGSVRMEEGGVQLTGWGWKESRE